MLVQSPKFLRVVLAKGKMKVIAYADDGRGALCEAINLLSMQTELEAGHRLTVEEDKGR